jgi:hypothetical protein
MWQSAQRERNASGAQRAQLPAGSENQSVNRQRSTQTCGPGWEKAESNSGKRGSDCRSTPVATKAANPRSANST